MEPQATTVAVDEVRRVFLRSHRLSNRVLEAADIPRGAIIEWLDQLPLAADQYVSVIWPHYGTGVRLQYGIFTNRYDDLWYPSADDVWVTDDLRSWLIEVSHEERLAFTYRPASDA
jgi:hypothetical protein